MDWYLVMGRNHEASPVAVIWKEGCLVFCRVQELPSGWPAAFPGDDTAAYDAVLAMCVNVVVVVGWWLERA